MIIFNIYSYFINYVLDSDVPIKSVESIQGVGLHLVIFNGYELWLFILFSFSFAWESIERSMGEYASSLGRGQRVSVVFS